MMNMKKLLALLLAIVMVVGMFPMTAMAEGEEPTCATCGSTEHTEHPADPAPQNLDETPDQTPADNCENCDNPECTGCDGTDSQNEEEQDKAPEVPVCTGDKTTCPIENCECKKESEPVCTGDKTTCLIENCECKKESEPVCTGDKTTCPIENCECKKESEPVCTGDKNTCPIENCTCKQEPAILCDKCKATETNEDGTVKHAETCETLKPAVLCEKCGATEKNEDGTVKHTETCETLCTCTPVDGVHQGECIFAPVVEACKTCGKQECECPKVGDKIWIKSGSRVYKDVNDTKGHTLILYYHVTIESIEYNEDGAATWYKFSPAVNWFGKYEYVKVENTTVENPEENNACNCQNPPENLAQHADSCPRKQYVKTLFENKTAEEIYAEWENYDEETQNDILNMLQKWDSEKYEELNKLIEEGFNNEQEVVVGDTNIVVAGIPKNVSLAVTDVSVRAYSSALNQYIGNDSELLYVYDITLKNPDGSEWQPANGQSVTITLDFNGMGFADGNMLSVLHEHDGELRSLGDFPIEEGKLTFTTDGFSKFYFYITYTYGEQSFAMSGGGTVMLSEILRELHISYSVSDVVNVSFSNPAVLKITRVGSDWKFESLAPFGSEEILTITFNDGEVIEIIVKDPVIYNYAVDSSITNVPKKPTQRKTFNNHNNGDDYALNKTFVANTNVITLDELMTAAGSAGSVSIIVYAEPGMAIGFEAGTNWGTADSEIGFARPTHSDNDIWYWSWIYDTTVDTYWQNYAIVKEGTAGQQTTFKIQAVKDNKKVTVNVTLCSVANSSPTLLQGNLPSGYSLKNVPVTLYNYDGKAFNSNYENGGQNYFAFSGVSMGANARTGLSNYGWASPSGEAANAGGSVAMMGIVNSNLVNGLPVMSQGQNVDLFSTNAISGKTVYEDVQFQFVYNENTGYYTYNAALNHAQYNSANNTIELYRQSLGPSDTPYGNDHGNAGFYPFVDINKAYTNTGYTAISQTEWVNKIENNFYELTPAQYAADIVPTNSTDPASTVDMNYGIQMASDFYMPKGKQLNGQDMIYKFTGDDDLWVFIDGKLVLDIGGGHTHVSGSFNLTTGEVWVEKYTKLDAASGGSYATETNGTNLKYTDEFLTGLKDDQMHTIQVFYLERHAGVSNCYMHFNLPLVPSNAVNVSKNLVNQDGEELSVTPDVDYTFTLYTAAGNNDDIDATNFAACANKSYTVMGSGAPSGTQTTDANGRFKLKDGWTASFAEIERFTEVYVVESEPNDDYIYTTKGMISVNKATATEYEYGKKSETKVMQLNSSINFDFVNKMQTQPLTVEKQVVNGTAGLIKADQKFDFDIVFTKDCLEASSVATTGNVTSIAVSDKETENDDTVHLGGTFQLGHAESVTIPRVPVNMTYTLKERNPDTTGNSFDAPVFQLNNGTKQTKVWSDADQDTNKVKEVSETFEGTIGQSSNVITVTNQQRFDLTITKEGILPVDHDDDELQSTIYTVTGKIGNDVLVEMDVAICGNESVTIKKLPVGTYTVEENENWSWRYTADDKTMDVIIPDNAQASLTYDNTRTKELWLSGDCYAKNLWTDTDINATGLVTTNGN